MRRLRIVFFALALISLAAGTAMAQSLSCALDGTQVVPPSASGATGFGCFVLDGTTNIIQYTYDSFGLEGTETFAGVYIGAPGTNGTLHTVMPPGNHKEGTVVIADLVEFTQLSAGNFYVQIDTDLYPNGEIRGFLNQFETCVPVSNEPRSWGTVKARFGGDA